MTNKMIRQASKWANYAANKSRFLKQKPNKRSVWDNIDPKFFIY